MELAQGELLFYSGIAIMISAAVIAIIAAIILDISQKRLRKRLEQEFGKSRHER